MTDDPRIDAAFVAAFAVKIGEVRFTQEHREAGLFLLLAEGGPCSGVMVPFLGDCDYTTIPTVADHKWQAIYVSSFDADGCAICQFRKIVSLRQLEMMAVNYESKRDYPA
jgi:hypothetical protein